MSHADHLASVRAIVKQALADLHLDTSEPLHETILIKGGNYCGRRFETAGAHAVWFIEEDQLKFFDARGRIARVIESVSQAGQVVRVAA